MKHFLVIILSLTSMAFFSNCSSAQLDKKAPATISKAYVQNWVGGRPGVKGKRIHIEMYPLVGQEIVFDSIYFQGKAALLESRTSGDTLILSANFNAPLELERNIIMASDSREEMANKPKEPSTTIPFKLADNECVISYLKKDKRGYFKLQDLKKEKTFFMQ